MGSRSAMLLAMLAFALAAQARAPLARSVGGAEVWQRDPRTRIVRVREDALVDLPWDTLAASGLDLAALPIERLQALRQGAEIPLQITARGVTFLAAANDSPASQEAAYWLVVGEAPGARALTPRHPTRALRWGPDQIYQPAARSARGDRWFAAELRAGAVVTAELDLPAPLAAASEVTLDLTPIDLRGDHRVELLVGGLRLGGAGWGDSRSGPRVVVVRTERDLPAGPTTIAVTLTTAAPDLVLLDALAIGAARLPLPRLTPQLERPRPAPDRTAVGQQIIAHPDLLPALAPLLDAKRALGRSAAAVDILALYDTYSWGERDPAALQAFLRDLAGRGALPGSVLLVGAGTARLRYGPGEPDPTRIPPLLIDVDPSYGEIACDSCYARLAADALPALPVGRLPVRTPEELATMVAKLVGELVTPPPGAWRARALLVADNDRDLGGAADPAGPFSPLLDAAAAQLPWAGVERLRYAPGERPGAGSYANAPALRERLLSAWDSGAALVIYAGHASPWQWAWTGAHEPVPHLMAASDAVRTNAGRLPILISLSCLSGASANPTQATLDEELLRQPGGGIIAALSPSGSGDVAGHALLLDALLPALSGGATLGEAHLAGVSALAARPEHRALAYGYAVLGDPDARLPRTPAGYRVVLPLVAQRAGPFGPATAVGRWGSPTTLT